MRSFRVSFDGLPSDAIEAHPKKMPERVTNHTARQLNPFEFDAINVPIFLHVCTNSCICDWRTGGMGFFDKTIDLAHLLLGEMPWFMAFGMRGEHDNALCRVPFFQKLEYTH